MGFLKNFSRTLHFDVISPLPRRAVDERLRPVVRTPEGNHGAVVRPIFKGELHPHGFSLRRRAPFPGMLITLQGTYVPETSGTRVVVLAHAENQIQLAFGMIAIYVIIFTFTVRSYLLDLLMYGGPGGSPMSFLVVPAGIGLALAYLIFAIGRANRGLKRDREELERLLMGGSSGG